MLRLLEVVVEDNKLSNSIPVVLLFEIAETLLSNVIFKKNSIDIKIAKTKTRNNEYFIFICEYLYDCLYIDKYFFCPLLSQNDLKVFHHCGYILIKNLFVEFKKQTKCS